MGMSEPSHMFTQLYCECWLAEIRLIYIKMVFKTHRRVQIYVRVSQTILEIVMQFILKRRIPSFWKNRCIIFFSDD